MTKIDKNVKNVLKKAAVCLLAMVLLVLCLAGCKPSEKQMGTFGAKLSELKESDDADVMYVVVEKDGTFCDFYAYKKLFGGWKEEFVTSGYLGRSGVLSDADSRRAGDGTTPGGVYSLGERFGINEKPKGLKGEYCQVNDEDYWDGDSNSPTYNQHVKSPDMPESWRWQSSEHLIDYKGSYNYCTMINFNVNPAIGGAEARGSCIFLHCTYPGETSSSGCVSIPEEYMVEALHLMDKKDAYIVILKTADEIDKYVKG